MHPILIDLPLWGDSRLVIPSFGACLAAAYLVALHWGFARAQRRGYDPDLVSNMFMVLILGAVGGARITYVMLEWDQFRDHLLDAFMIWKGGLVFYGGIVGGYLLSALFLYRHKVPVLPMADLSVSCVAAGHMIGRLGCFLNGCCYGQVCNAPWGLTFHGLAGDQPRHPTQIYEILGLAIILAIVERIYRRAHRPGTVISLYLAFYAVLRFLVEMVRGDDRGGEMLLGLSISQDIAIVGLIAGAGLWALARTGPVIDPDDPIGGAKTTRS